MVSLLSLFSLAVFASPAQETQEARKFIVSPQAVPSPALRYVLLPPLKDLKTGNAVQHYYRCMVPDAIHYYRANQFDQQLLAWLDLPYEQAAKKGLPPSKQQSQKTLDDGSAEVPPFTYEEVSVLRSQFSILDEIDLAARRTHTEWDYLERMKEQGMRLLLPDLQAFRMLANLVGARTRLACMNGEHEAALRHLQTNLAMAQHLNQAQVLMSSFVGLAVVKFSLKHIDEFIQTPHAPNLYWALTELPTPLLDLRQAYAGDRLTIEYMLGDPKQLEERILTNEEVQTLINKKLKPLLQYSDAQGRRDLTLVILKEYPKAKAWLLEKGRPAADVEKMTATQVVLLHARAQFQVLADDFAKYFHMPLADRLAHAEEFKKKILDLRNRQDMSYFLGFVYYSYYPNVWISVIDSDREIALLRCIEVLRHYAAKNNRQLPGDWDAVKDLPIPVDPVSGKRFSYQLSGDHALITLEAIAGSPIHRKAKQVEVYLK